MSTEDPARMELSGTRTQLITSNDNPAASPMITARDSLLCVCSLRNWSRSADPLSEQTKAMKTLGIAQAIDCNAVALRRTEDSSESRVPTARPRPTIAYLLRIFIWGINRSMRAPVAIWTNITAEARRIDTLSLTVPEGVLDVQSQECWRVLLQRIPALQ